jgi:hypothetical protein
MKTLQQKKDCIIHILQRYESEFAEQIERLNLIKEDIYDAFYAELCVSVATTHKELLAEIHLCQNNNEPTEIQIININ